jgi:2-oxoisovalerate dehydrogenase E2 component (dihydrolipoyl transacylase)
VATSPAIRRRAHEGGVNLQEVQGSGPNGRITTRDFEAYVSSHAARSGPVSARPEHVREAPVAETPAPAAPGTKVVPVVEEEGAREIKVVGVRRLIAERMSEAKRSIPHFSYVEEVDLTELERLRTRLNNRLSGSPPLTYLPFLALALIAVLRRFPQCNAHYDDKRGVLVQHAAVHMGIATQTPEGLKVPVLRGAQRLDLWEMAAGMRRVTEGARSATLARNELTGSTITITSLGKLGGIASTPIINLPEVAIIGVNRAVERPVVMNGEVVVRRMMNLSSSFDHRFVDGYDAAAMIQALKERLEEPVTIFTDLPEG